MLGFDVLNIAGTGALPLELSSMQVNGAGFDIIGGDCKVGTDLGPGASCSTEVGFTPAAIGASDGKVSIGTVNGDTVVVTLVGTGLEPVEEVFGDRFERNH